MNKEDFAAVIKLVRSAPLANMDTAEAVGKLLQKFAAHAVQYLEEQEAETNDETD